MLLLASGIVSGHAQSSAHLYPGSYYWPPHIYEYNRSRGDLPEQRMDNRYGYRDYGYKNHHRSHDGCGSRENYSNRGNSYRPLPMGDENFRTVMNYISGLSFDSEKLTQAKQIARNNVLSSVQIKQLMAELTFDSNRLELAKAAFPNVHDKGMYFIVGEAFTFSSSREKLSNYLVSLGY